MRRFLSCVDNLLTFCPELPQDGALRKLINPEHVRTSVPNLCNNVNSKYQLFLACLVGWLFAACFLSVFRYYKMAA